MCMMISWVQTFPGVVYLQDLVRKALAREYIKLQFWVEQWDDDDNRNYMIISPAAALAIGWCGPMGIWSVENLEDDEWEDE